jgi:hypothetical protein
MATFGIAAANLVVNYRAERIIAANAKQAAIEREAGEKAAEQEYLRQQAIENEMQEERTAALRAHNEETEREIKRLERENKATSLDTWGPDGPPKGINTKACREWTSRAAAGQITDPPPPNCT